MSGWLAELNDKGIPHVTPVDDLRPHDVDGECWCRPWMDDHVVVHNSMDRREEYERGRAMQ
jgi:hypothetical protein